MQGTLPTFPVNNALCLGPTKPVLAGNVGNPSTGPVVGSNVTGYSKVYFACTVGGWVAGIVNIYRNWMTSNICRNRPQRGVQGALNCWNRPAGGARNRGKLAIPSGKRGADVRNFLDRYLAIHCNTTACAFDTFHNRSPVLRRVLAPAQAFGLICNMFGGVWFTSLRFRQFGARCLRDKQAWRAIATISKVSQSRTALAKIVNNRFFAAQTMPPVRRPAVEHYNVRGAALAPPTVKMCRTCFRAIEVLVIASVERLRGETNVSHFAGNRISKTIYKPRHIWNYRVSGGWTT